ncbi:MAG: peptidylprolyl isomerase [Ruminiclostridium sp.]|nr:peptidylprolyl isomerase [Ruminiclostridium sp.]
MKQKTWAALMLCAGLILTLAGCGGSQYGDYTTEAAVTHYAEIQVENYGTITLTLDGQAAPETVANFVALAEDGFYDGLTFHRIIEGFVIQGGDPEGDGTGGSGTTIQGEFRDNKFDNPLSHVRGAVSMARSQKYNSASSQFFIVHQDSADLDGAYAVFGYVTEGMDVVDAIVVDAQPTDRNGSILPEDQPVITTVMVTEA